MRDTSHRARGARERTLRIIAGQWRGRRFRFPALALRPTPDRVRETLFNWLSPRLRGAHCLDLYAGSGALGLEALSRGAATVTFVDREPAAIAALERLLRDWGANGWSLRCEPAAQLLGAGPPPTPLDIVFLDPPFASQELPAALAALSSPGWLAPGARLYVEHARDQTLPALPAGWQQLRAGTAGEVGYHLLAPGGGAET